MKKSISNLRVPIIAVAFILTCFTIYFLFLPDLRLSSAANKAELYFIGGLGLLATVTLLVVLINLTGLLWSKNRSARRKKLGGQMIFLGIILFALAAFVLGSQWAAHTPAILAENGEPLPGSIATMEKIELGGVNQWLIIRAEDVNKPVLLFLSGGPGGSEAARVLRFNQELEKHFVVVIWEQRGCGKSYPSLNPKEDLTVAQYASDIIELTNLLRERFDEEKIYLVGHSWGTIIAVRAAQERPDLFHAYISSSQMVNVLETDQMIYDMVLDHSRQNGDTQVVKTLETQGEPPYFGKMPIKPYAFLFGREYVIYEYPNIKNPQYRQDGDILLLMLKQPEYGWLDRLYYLLGLMNTFNAVYPQLQEMDLRIDAPRLELPVYMILGRHDMNNPYQIPEDYFNLLQAPSKQLFFFENSGHGTIWEEADLYHQIFINTILPETYEQ